MGNLKTTRDSRVEPLFLFLLTVATRLPFTSRFLFHYDSCQFALALKKYDIFLHQPHPPGYFLYIMLGRLIGSFIDDANKIFIFISIVFSGLAVTTIYYLGKNLYDRKIGLLAAFLAITSPNLWFHGEIALSYVLEAFFSTLVALLCWKVVNGRHGLVLILGFVLAIAGGIRQNTPVFLFPLWLYSMKSLPVRKIIASFAVFCLVSLSWFIPMILMSGGWGRYINALVEHREFVVANRSVFTGGISLFFHYASIILRFVIYSVGAGLAVLGLALYAMLRNGDLSTFVTRKTSFFVVWALPSILFYLTIFINIANPGYALVFLPCLLILTAVAIEYICSNIFHEMKNRIGIVLSAGVVVMNGILFFCFPHPVSYLAIKSHNINFPVILQEVKKFDTTETAVFAQTYINYSYRHMMYYLPDYHVYNACMEKNQFGEMRKTFEGFHGETALETRIALPDTITSFVAVVIDPEEEKNAQTMRGLRHVTVKDVGSIFSGPIDLVGDVYQEDLRLKLKL